MHPPKLWRERGSGRQVAGILMNIPDANRKLGLYKEGIQQEKEALGTYEQLNDNTQEQALLYDSSIFCCITTSNLTPPKKPHYA